MKIQKRPCLPVRASALLRIHFFVIDRCGCVHTEMRPRPRWTPQSTWRRQKSRGCTGRRPRSSPASICCTPVRCCTTTPCCPSPPWRTTVPVRTLLVPRSVCVCVSVYKMILIIALIPAVVMVDRQGWLSLVLLIIVASRYLGTFALHSPKFSHHVYVCVPSVWKYKELFHSAGTESFIWTWFFFHAFFPPLCLLFSVLSSTLSEMVCVRSELLTYFTHVLLGDSLAAEYLILHLISDVYVTFSPICTSELQKDE